jgi:hypothetical protein
MEMEMACAARHRPRPVRSLVGWLALAATFPAGLLDRPFQHVQASDERSQVLLNDGYQHSAVFRQIVADLEDSDWVIFIQSGRCPETRLFGCLLNRIGDFHGRRYLQIVLNVRLCPNDCLLAKLAHELRHAYEVVTSPDVVDDESLNLLFARLSEGRRQHDRTTNGQALEVYETAAALEVEREVLRELRQNKIHR